MKQKNKPDSKIKLSLYPDSKENLTVLEEIVNEQPKRIKTSKLETLEIKKNDIEESLSIISYNENQIPTNDCSQTESQNKIKKSEKNNVLSPRILAEKSISPTKLQLFFNNSPELCPQLDSQEDPSLLIKNNKIIDDKLYDQIINYSKEAINNNKSIEIEKMIDEESMQIRELNLADVERLIEYYLIK